MPMLKWLMAAFQNKVVNMNLHEQNCPFCKNEFSLSIDSSRDLGISVIKCCDCEFMMQDKCCEEDLMKKFDEKFNSDKHFNELTPSEAERIFLLMEEAGEVVQACAKILRHGYESHNPFDERETPNRELLERELGDLEFARTLMVDKGDIKIEKITEFSRLKNLRIGKYLHRNNV